MAEHAALLRFVRAARTLDGVAAEPTPDGVLLGGTERAPVIPWAQIDTLLGDDDPLGPRPRQRLGLTFALHAAVRALGGEAADVLARAARPLALPAGHRLHPGAAWVVDRVPGGALDLGVGVVRLLPGQDGAVPLPPDVAAAAGVAASPLWPGLRGLLERLSVFALDRIPGTGPQAGVLRSVGGCDALTLLGSPQVRERLAACADGPGPAGDGPGTGAVEVAAPRRDRVWTGGAAADADYVRAVWLLTAPAERGLPGPVRVTPATVAPSVAAPAR